MEFRRNVPSQAGVCEREEAGVWERGKAPQRIKIERGEDNLEHWKNLIRCSRERNKNTWSPMDLAYRTQTVLQMAMAANKQGKTMKYDKAAMSFS